MKRIIKFLVLIMFLLFPFQVNAISKDYEDLIYKIVDKKVEENAINIYLFYKDGCPHCEKEEKFLREIEKKYSNINIYMFEVSKNSKNSNLLTNVKSLFSVSSPGVPFTVIGKNRFLGYNDYIGNNIEKNIQAYLEINKENPTEKEKNTFKLPILGEVNVKNASLPTIAILLGLIDGFNPCAMWILLFLINMLFNMREKKKMFILGYTFLITSGLVYFLSMLGINFVLNMVAINWIQRIIALIAIITGILNIKNYIRNRKETGCHVVDDKKRKKIFTKIQKLTSEKNIFIALLGVMALAISINLIELACSLGFPAVFSEILSLNSVTGISRIIYLLIYVLFYMIDDLIVFTIAVSTLSITTKSTKYTKYTNLIAGIIMLLMGLLLIFKPEWVMFNF